MDTKEVLDKTFNIIVNYIENLNTEGQKVLDYLPARELKSKIDFSIEKDGVDYNQIFELIDKYITYGVKTGNKQFFNQKKLTRYPIPNL